MEEKFIVVSDYCGTRINNNTYTKQEAERIAKKETEQAKKDFPEVTFSAIKEED